ncbi:MAG: T9SS C-terminal target domain-containing protein [Calditrichaeota bacterium]|nr:MAG: T9SS C-terminal target domain-containing protein [Calditrichota bacterium]
MQTEASAGDSVVVSRPELSGCQIEFVSPEDGATVESDSVAVTGITRIFGGAPGFTLLCDINGTEATVSDTVFSAVVPLSFGENTLVATCVVTDSCGNQTVCVDTLRVVRPTPTFSCEVEIVSPRSGTLVCDEDVRVVAVARVRGGVAPISAKCEINGVRARARKDSVFSAEIPLDFGRNPVEVVCVFTDSHQNQTVCKDTILVLRPKRPDCVVSIRSPKHHKAIRGEKVEVVGFISIRGGVPPFRVTCDVNGIRAAVSNKVFTVMVPVGSGANRFVARCVVVDDCGNETVCRDTVDVLRDKTPPVVSFNATGHTIRGQFVDRESGIAEVVPVSLENAQLHVQPFSPGDPVVRFQLVRHDPSKVVRFEAQLRDPGGSTFTVNPTLVHMSADDLNRQRSFSFPRLSRYLQLHNSGLSEIHITLNGKPFTLISDPVRAHRAFNGLLIPEEGTFTVDLADYLREGMNNVSVGYAGPAGSRATLVISNAADGVDTELKLQAVPEEFRLSQNYPNPFNPVTRIVFDIPARLAEGTIVKLRIYNILGENIRTLLHEKRLPGRYTVDWDGKDDSGESVASGTYIYQLSTDDFSAARKMVLLR